MIDLKTVMACRRRRGPHGLTLASIRCGGDGRWAMGDGRGDGAWGGERNEGVFRVEEETHPFGHDVNSTDPCRIRHGRVSPPRSQRLFSLSLAGNTASLRLPVHLCSATSKRLYNGLVPPLSSFSFFTISYINFPFQESPPSQLLLTSFVHDLCQSISPIMADGLEKNALDYAEGS